MSAKPLYRRMFLPALLWTVSTVLALPPMLTGLENRWLSDGSRLLLHEGAATVSWLVAAWVGARLFRLAVNHGDRPVPRLLSDMVAISLFGAAIIIIVATVFDQPVGVLITTSGMLVAVLGFSLRELISDVFAGICINMERPFTLGDWLEVPPVKDLGKVTEINWRATRLVTTDGITVVVPNGIIAHSRFLNYSKPQRHFRVSVPVVLDYEVPAERARYLLFSALRATPGVLAEPAPIVHVDAYTEHGLRYLARFWVADGEHMMPVRSQVVTTIHRHLWLGGVQLRHGRSDLMLARAGVVGTDLDQRRVGVLGQVTLFRALNAEDLDELAGNLEVRHVHHEAVVVEAGAAGRSLFVVVEGVLEVRGEDGILATLAAGDVFGEMSLLTGAPRSATVVAATESTLFEISDRELAPILRRRPELADGLGAIIEQRRRANRARCDGGDDPGVTSSGPPLFSLIREFFGISR
ncbi:MAG: mechanosensitive ion channel family protein [Rhodospirillaceae bacterium]